MTERIIIAGSGGQGIMLLGKVLVMAATHEDKFVSWLPSYGAEVRGGSAYCMVIISTQEIGSPYIDKADTLFIMNRPSLDKFQHRINPQGLFLINSSLIDTNFLTCINVTPSATMADKKSGHNHRQSIEICTFPFTDIAVSLGDIKVANMVALGCYLAKKKVVRLASVLKVFTELTNNHALLELNKQALRRGFSLIK